MGIKLNCDRCGRFIKNVSIKNINTLTEGDSVCKICTEVEIRHKAYIDRFKTKVTNDALKFVSKWHEEYEKLLKKAVEERMEQEKE